MAKKLTALELTQNILNAMDSDEVETLTETIESNQVHDLLEMTFYELIDRRAWEFMKHQPRQLDAGTHVTELAIPSDVVHVELVRYKDFDTSRMVDVRYLSPADFLDRQQGLDTTQANIESVTVNDGVAIGVYNDRRPEYWTSFDEENIVFSSYDTANEPSGVTVASSTTLCEYQPTWTKADAFVPDIPARMFSLLFNEALSVCSLNVKQEANPKAEQNARRQYIRLRELERVTVADQEEINYGRQTHNHRIGLHQRR
jgi:hypothetical protein